MFNERKETDEDDAAGLQRRFDNEPKHTIGESREACRVRRLCGRITLSTAIRGLLNIGSCLECDCGQKEGGRAAARLRLFDHRTKQLPHVRAERHEKWTLSPGV